MMNDKQRQEFAGAAGAALRRLDNKAKGIVHFSTDTTVIPTPTVPLPHIKTFRDLLSVQLKEDINNLKSGASALVMDALVTGVIASIDRHLIEPYSLRAVIGVQEDTWDVDKDED